VSIERQGVPIPNPTADTIIYPIDKLFLLGQDENLRRAEHRLDGEAGAVMVGSEKPQLSDLSLEPLTVPNTSRQTGIPLGSLALNALFGIQIAGIKRANGPLLSPGRSETLQSGDQLLVLGTPEQVNELAFWLST